MALYGAHVNRELREPQAERAAGERERDEKMTNDREAAYIREVWRGLYVEASERGDEASMERCALQMRKLDERLRETTTHGAPTCQIARCGVAR